MPSSTIRGNHVHDNRGGPGGIYLDEGSGFIEVTDNLVYNIGTPMNYHNNSQNRRATCKEHANLFFTGKPSAMPSAAESIIQKAGLEPEYRDLMKQKP